MKLLITLLILLTPTMCIAEKGETKMSETIKETLVYSHYVIEEKVPSKIDPIITLTNEVGLRCPGTDDIIDPLEHGESATCPNGLIVQRFGNSLHCTMEIK